MENRRFPERTPITRAGRKHDLTNLLFRPRGLAALLAVSFVLGVALTLTTLPLDVILGTAPFWEFPHGTVPLGIVDMAQTLLGYQYFALSPWTLPVLKIPNLAPPGTNLVWLDAVPLVCLLAKTIVSVSGVAVNLIGVFLFLCFAVPGVAMTALLWVAGQRGLIAALVATALACSMPLLLFEWGHVALCAQSLLILAMLLYVLSQQRPNDNRVAAAWIGLLVITLLTSNYLFVMVGGLWSAAVLQRRLNARVTPFRFVVESATAVGTVVGVAAIMGILSAELRFGGTNDYGFFSMNLGSPFVPQMSGVLPPLSNYLIGMPSQVFDYLGLGVIVVLAAALPGLLSWPRRFGKSHVVLIGVLCGFLLFALSNKITLGSHVLLHIPLPDRIAYAFGAFRASGRFFWPIGYILTFAGIVLVLRAFRPRASLAILAVASVLQVVDSFPQRLAIRATTREPAPWVVDHLAAASVIDASHGVMVFPTSRCVWAAVVGDEAAELQAPRLLQVSVELQMLASRRNTPINSAFTDRLETDCEAENAIRREPLDPGVAYFYLTGAAPGADQLGGLNPVQACKLIDQIRYCLVPSVAKK